MDGLQAWVFSADYRTPPPRMGYVGATGGKKPAVQAEEMGKSPPLVKEAAMKPIFRVNKPP